MKKICAIFLGLLFLLPAFMPWMPLASAKALHIQREAHHQYELKSHTHTHSSESSGAHVSKQGGDHGFYADVLTYFHDYLHVDLQRSKQIGLTAPSQDSQRIGFIPVADQLPPQRIELASLQNRGPPDYNRRALVSSTRLYLGTQRLRI